MLDVKTMAESIVFSKYSHVFRNPDGVSAYYNSLRIKPVYVSQDTSEYIDRIRHGESLQEVLFSIPSEVTRNNVQNTFAILYKNKVFIDAAEDENIIYKFKSFTGKPAVKIAYFILTDNCNFNCSYCFVKKGMSEEYKCSNMSLETAIKALDLYCKLIGADFDDHNDEKSIILYGGEPLLNFDLLKLFLPKVEECKNVGKLPKNIQINIVTNGSLLDSEKIRLFEKYNVGIGISIDGDELATNSCRKYSDGRPTYLDIKKGIDCCKKEKADFTLSTTLTLKSINNFESTLDVIINQIGAKSLGFNILMAENHSEQENYAQLASEFIINSFKIFREKGIFEDRIMRKVEAFVESRVHMFDCAAAGGNQIVFAPNGDIGICHGFIGNRKFFVSNIYNDCDFSPLRCDEYIEWSKRTPINMEKCQDCYALGICGGGCPLNAYQTHGSIWELDERFCVHSKMTLEWLIWDLYDKLSNRP